VVPTVERQRPAMSDSTSGIAVPGLISSPRIAERGRLLMTGICSGSYGRAEGASTVGSAARLADNEASNFSTGKHTVSLEGDPSKVSAALRTLVA